jgi:hypothetical protein
MDEKSVLPENLDIQDIKVVLDMYSKLSDRQRELFLATIRGMTLVIECDGKGA